MSGRLSAPRANPHGSAKLVGRVGALALFLGIGTAFALPGTAVADTDTGSSSSSASSAHADSASSESASRPGARVSGEPNRNSRGASASGSPTAPTGTGGGADDDHSSASDAGEHDATADAEGGDTGEPIADQSTGQAELDELADADLAPESFTEAEEITADPPMPDESAPAAAPAVNAPLTRKDPEMPAPGAAPPLTRRQPGVQADPVDRRAAPQILDQVRDLIEIAFPLTPPLLPPLTINVNNGRPEYLSVDIPEGKFIFYIGALSGVSTEAFYVLNNHVDADIDDNDVPQILEELLTGTTGGLGDDEAEPGLDGFELISLTPGSYSLAIADGEPIGITDLADHLPSSVLAWGILPGLAERVLEPILTPWQAVGLETYDILTLQGPAMPGLIAGLDRDVALGDGINGFGLIDLDEEAVTTGGDPIGTPEAAAALLAAALDRADPRVRLLGVEKDSISVVVHEQDSPAFDYLVLTGQSVADAVELAERGAVDPANGVSELVIATGDGGRVVATGGAAFDGVLVRGLGAEITEDELPILLRSLARRPGVNAVDQGDTVRFEIRGSDGTVDVIVFETDRAPGNGGYDVGFLRAQRHDEFAGLLGDLHRRPLATLAEQVQYTLSDVLNFAFSVPALRALFEAIAPGLNLADAEPLTEQPVVDVANGVPETAAVTIPLGEFVFEIGDTFAVGTEGGFSLLSSLLALPISELSGILRAEVDADDNDNDAQQLLEEILNGRSGAQLDFESEPGIDGVQLVGLTPVSFTLAFADGVQTDRLTFEGPGSEAILAGFDARGGADLADGQNNLSLIDVGSEELVLGDGPANPIFDLVGDGFAGDADLAALIAAATGGSNPAVSLVSQDAGSISVRIDNPMTGEFDLLVFYDPTGTTDLL